ncbi:MAG: hypothetical protein DRJ15_01585 [Bacteroidetes bacterium]|nr:MAG: hypothetical protein DRJ15_01585 [Bacteroidota bacterium]
MADVRAADKAAQKLNRLFPSSDKSFRSGLPKPPATGIWAKVQEGRKAGKAKYKGGRYVEVPLEIDSPFSVIKGFGNQTTKAKELKKYEKDMAEDSGIKD